MKRVSSERLEASRTSRTTPYAVPSRGSPRALVSETSTSVARPGISSQSSARGTRNWSSVPPTWLTMFACTQAVVNAHASGSLMSSAC